MQATLTPMMQQWLECKNQAKGAILLFRLGDFYECFEEDAQLVAKELELTLTQRQETPMCGIPWHTSEGYIERLVNRGYRVAIADQVEDPKKAKGLVSRKVVRVVSPATHTPLPGVQEKTSSYFTSITCKDDIFGLATVDLASARFTVYETASPKELLNELFRQSPKELLLSRRFQTKYRELLQEIQLASKLQLSVQDDWLFDPVDAEDRLKGHFRVQTLDGFGLKAGISGITAAGALVHYLSDWQLCPLDHIREIKRTNSDLCLFLDRQTLINLEILEPTDREKADNSLVTLLDETKTPMGARLLRQWLKAPLVDLDAIRSRQEAIKALWEAPFDAELAQIRDLERMMYRIKTQSAGPKEFVALRTSLEQLPAVARALAALNLKKEIDLHEECSRLIGRALIDNPPFRASDGGLFRAGYNQKLDELTALRQGSQDWLIAYQERLRQESGIKTLKVGFTRMFGYYIEISKGQIERVPSHFQRRQTLVNGERYITDELKQYEEKILTADSMIEAIEQELFSQLRSEVASYHDSILKSAKTIAEVDVLRALAIAAKKRGYICPKMVEGSSLTIKEGRHPIIEALATTSHFVANDIQLDGKNQSLILLTGPNMAGKSTYIRQIALLVIMAQLGSFIPAKEAEIGIVDKLFSRIGASDDLARGQSTFMVEMAETASILNQATDRSLVILDEIGRGTSTYDGISIAWAVAEYLLTGKARPKTLFATHYFELTELADKLKGACNYTVAIAETKDNVQFLRKIVPGVADKSYGIHVARLAGMPDAVVERAKKLLKTLEESPTATRPQRGPAPDLFAQQELLTKDSLLTKELLAINVSAITPLDALIKLAHLQKLIKN